jgi:glutamate--cysteine ligase
MSTTMNVKEAERAHLLSRPLKDTPPADLVSIFASAAKPTADWLLGLEIELSPFHLSDLAPLQHPELVQMFAQLAERAPYVPDFDPSGIQIGLRREGHVISLEPGGQFEYATRPYRRIRDLESALLGFARDLKEAGQAVGVGFWAIGHHPFGTRDTMPKMPKSRYQVMRNYMAHAGTRGLDMMHLTGSVQCAIDFSDEANMIDKVRAAAKISPFIAALTASSPFTAGKPNGKKTARYEIWFDVDKTRCGIWPEMVDAEGLTYQRYIEHALAAPAMFFMREGNYRVAEPKPYRAYAESGFSGTTVTVSDFLDHLTTMFPEIRIKSYIELRGSDCLPPKEALAIAAFWRGILDVPEARKEACDRLAKMDHAALLELQHEVVVKGLEANSASGPALEIARFLMETAQVGLCSVRATDCAGYLEPLKARAASGRTLADDMLARAAKAGIAEALKLCEI